jgi:hypothetical protein
MKLPFVVKQIELAEDLSFVTLASPDTDASKHPFRVPMEQSRARRLKVGFVMELSVPGIGLSEVSQDK